jgi:hypothetical protein
VYFVQESCPGVFIAFCATSTKDGIPTKNFMCGEQPIEATGLYDTCVGYFTRHLEFLREKYMKQA